MDQQHINNGSDSHHLFIGLKEPLLCGQSTNKQTNS
jgi:hypothetical protein